MARTRSLHWPIAIVLLICTAGLGWLAQRFDTGVDVTANGRHSLTPTTEATLAAIPAPISVTVVLGPEPAARNAVDDLLSRYQALKPDLSWRFVNPDTDPATVRELGADPAGELIIQGLGREQRLTRLSERALTGALRQLNREGDRRIAFVTGHQERSPERDSADDWAQLSERLQSIGLVSTRWSLVTDPIVPDDIDVLVLAAPRRPYFPGEVAGLLDWIGRGGQLLWLIEADIAGQSGTGLAALGLELGIDRLPGVVIDTASQALETGAVDVVVLDRFPAHPVNAALAEPVVLPEAYALGVTPLAGQTTLPLLQTGESSWTETGPLQGEVRFDGEPEQDGPLVLGVTIERDTAGRPQRIAVLGDADLGSDRFIGQAGNALFLERLLLWLAGEDDSLAFATPDAPDAYLQLRRTDIILLTTGWLVALPLSLLLLAGVLAWRRRR